jgi:hypothetical protein
LVCLLLVTRVARGPGKLDSRADGRLLHTLRTVGGRSRSIIRKGQVRDPARTQSAAASVPEEPIATPCQNMSPIEGVACQKMSPIAAQHTSLTFESTDACGTSPVSSLIQPFQEEEGQDPEPTRHGQTPGALPQAQQLEAQETAIRLSSCENEDVTEEEYTAAVARLETEGTNPAFLIRPVVLAEVQRARQEAAQRSTAAPEAPDEPTVPCRAPAPCPATPQRPQAPVRAPPTCPRLPISLPPPTLRNVTLADLRDVGRLLVLHQQARARGWLRGGEAAQLTIVAAAVHARRVGQSPCRLFVALLRDQRWELITQEDEDEALAILRAYRDGPCRRSTGPTATPAVPMPDNARFVLLAEQVLRQAGWQGDPCLAVMGQYPTWTRVRWDQAQAALAQWRQQQTRARGQAGGLEPLALGWEAGEAQEDEATDEGATA